MIYHVDVFCTVLTFGVLGGRYAGFVITKEQDAADRVLRDQLINKPLYPNSFLRSMT